MKNIGWLSLCILALLVGCGPNEKELAEKGFSSAKEMEQYRSLGYNSKQDYLKKNLSSIGRRLIETASSSDKTRPYVESIKNIFKGCHFKDVFALSAVTSVDCNLSQDATLSDSLLSSTVNFTYDIRQAVVLQITRNVTDPKSRLSLFGGVDGLAKERVQCEFIDSESDASNDISVNIVSTQGVKKFIVKEHLRQLTDRWEHITTIYYNTSGNCKLLEAHNTGIGPIDAYSKNPAFNDPSFPEEVKSLAVRKYDLDLGSVSISKIDDINHDGQDDYLVAAGGGFCGSAGCSHAIIHSLKNAPIQSAAARYAIVYEDNVYGIDFVRNPKSKVIFVAHMHGSACGKVGAEGCTKNFVWYRNAYMREEEVIALTDIIPPERVLLCGILNGSVIDELKRSNDANDIPMLKSALASYYAYQRYMKEKHEKYMSRDLKSLVDSIQAQVSAMDKPSKVRSLSKCNSDARINLQRKKLLGK